MFYAAPFTFDFDAQQAIADAGTTSVSVSALYAACKLAQASEEGILNDRIAFGSGLVSLGSGVQVGLTVQMLDAWQLKFQAGAYQAKVSGGNLVGGPDGDPIAYSPGVQAFVILSAAATVVDTGGGGSMADDVTQIRALAEADEVFDHEAGLLHTYQRGTTIDLIPPKAVTGTMVTTDTGLAQP